MHYTTSTSIEGGVQVDIDGRYRLDFPNGDVIEAAGFMAMLGDGARSIDDPTIATRRVLDVLCEAGVTAVMSPAGTEPRWWQVIITNPYEAVEVLTWDDRSSLAAKVRQLRGDVHAYLDDPDGHPNSSQEVLEAIARELDVLYHQQLLDHRSPRQVAAHVFGGGR